MSGAKQLDCGTHGPVEWNGEAMCALEDGGCGTLHLIVVGDDEHVCCEAFDIEQPENTLRPICKSCFDGFGGAGAKVPVA